MLHTKKVSLTISCNVNINLSTITKRFAVMVNVTLLRVNKSSCHPNIKFPHPYNCLVLKTEEQNSYVIRCYELIIILTVILGLV